MGDEEGHENLKALLKGWGDAKGCEEHKGLLWGGKGRQKDVEKKRADSMECCRLELLLEVENKISSTVKLFEGRL